MKDVFHSKLTRIEKLLDTELTSERVNEILVLLGSTPMEEAVLNNLFLYNETLPKAEESPFSEHDRFMHFLWDAFDKLPMCLVVPFAIPFRRAMAERMFASCGKGVIIEENLRFNFYKLISIGEGTFINRNAYLDSKGSISIGEYVGIAEDVRIFTHGHSESSHLERSYSPVVIGDYAKVYSGVTILPGVSIGKEAIVGSGAMVTKDVPDGMVATGIPAKVVRERHCDGRHGYDLDHLWLF